MAKKKLSEFRAKREQKSQQCEALWTKVSRKAINKQCKMSQFPRFYVGLSIKTDINQCEFGPALESV